MKKMGFVAAVLLAGSLVGACSKKKDTATPANPCAAQPCAAPANPCAAPANPCAAPAPQQ
jgi:hypothetical protein